MIIPFKVGIITASDRCFRGERQDQSGDLLRSLVETLPAEVVGYQVVPDHREVLKKTLCLMADLLGCDVILTTGGTGLGPRDVTPEATQEVIQKEIPGIPEAIRIASLKKTPSAMLSRAVAGIRGKALIINLPGSPDAVLEAFECLRSILFHAVELVRGEVADCQKALHSSQLHS